MSPRNTPPRPSSPPRRPAIVRLAAPGCRRSSRHALFGTSARRSTGSVRRTARCRDRSHWPNVDNSSSTRTRKGRAPKRMRASVIEDDATRPPPSPHTPNSRVNWTSECWQHTAMATMIQSTTSLGGFRRRLVGRRGAASARATTFWMSTSANSSSRASAAEMGPSASQPSMASRPNDDAPSARPLRPERSRPRDRSSH